MPLPLNAITEFRKEHWFLSNYFAAPILVNGITFPSNEHAFAAFKTTDVQLRQAISQLPTPSDAKKRGRSLNLRSDWESIKVEVMRQLIFQKFAQHANLAMNLIETGVRPLYEGNTWRDLVWGVDVATGDGENLLGRLLMERRSKIRTRIYDAAESFAAMQCTPHDFASASVAGDEALLHGITDVLGVRVAERFFAAPSRLRGLIFAEEPEPVVVRAGFHA